MPIPKYTEDKLPDTIGNVLPLLLVIPLLFPFMRMCYMLITEKEKKIKEGMKMMGLSDMAFYLSWIIYYTVIYTIISVLWTIIMSSVWTNSSGLLLFIWYWLYCMTLVPLSLLIW